MPLAIPYLVPFANAAGIVIGSVATAVGLSALSDKVQDYMEEFPEESMKILAMIMPEQGIAALFNKEAGDEGEGEEIEGEEIIDLDEDKPKSKKSKKEIVLEEVRRYRRGKGNWASKDATGPAISGRGNVRRGLTEAGKIPKDIHSTYNPKKPKFNWKRFTRNKADGGRIGFFAGGATQKDFDEFLKLRGEANREYDLDKLMEDFKQWFKKQSGPEAVDVKDGGIIGLKKGGRIGFQSGGSGNWWDGLTGQGLSIYNSMTLGGHSDQSIQDTLTALGYWPIPAATGIETIVNTNINQGGGGNGGGGDEDSGYAGLGMSPGALGGKLPGFGNWAKRALGDISYAYSKVPSVTKAFGWAANQISDWNEARKEKKEAKLQAEIDAANKKAWEESQAKQSHEKGQWGGHGSVEAYDTSQQATYDRAVDRHRGAQGGLATMFQRRR